MTTSSSNGTGLYGTTGNVATPTASSNYTGLYGGTGTAVVPRNPYGNANVVGLLSAGSDGANTVANIVATGNVSANYFLGNGSLLTGIASSYGNANVAAFLPTYTGALAAGTISATGNIVTDSYFVGNFSGNITGNITVPGSNTQVLFNNNGNAGASSDFTFNDATNVLSVNGNIVAANYSGSGAALSAITGANVTGTVANAAYATAAGSATTATTANVALVANSVAGANVSGAVAQATQAATANVANSVAGANVTGTVASATVAATVSGAAQANITSVGTLTALSVSGNITSSGNIAGNFFLGNGSQLTGITANYSNANVTSLLAAFGSNTINSTGNITTTANISGGFILGNGSLLTGLPATYGNANVAAYLPTYTGAMTAMTGNITTTANITGAYLFGNGSQLTGIAASYGNANVAAYLPTYTGNIGAANINLVGSGGSINTNGAVLNSGTLLGPPGSFAGVFSRYVGNSATSGYVEAGVNGAGLASIAGAGNIWLFDGTTSNITLPNDTAAINYANGVNILSGVTTTYGNANVAAYLPTYTGNIGTVGGGVGAANITNLVASEIDVGSWAISTATNDIVGTGLISTTGNVVGNNVSGTIRTASQPFITTVGTLGSLNVTTDIGALGNITASGNLSTSGVLSAAGNVNASQNIVATGNIQGGNIVTTGLISTSGRIAATGNINTSSNVVATGNIATSGFFIGDGSLLTNIPGGSYGNANVAAYLPTFTGNVGAGNVNLLGQNTVFGEGAGLNGQSGVPSTDRLVAIGYQAGNVGNTAQASTLVGYRAGSTNNGTNTVAIGERAGNNAQGTYAVAVGSLAAANAQGLQAIAIGYNAATNNQGVNAIAIGSFAGNNQGNSSIVIGGSAGNAAVANSIVISTQGTTSTGAGLFIDPVRADSGNVVNAVFYNTTTKEISYANAAAGSNTQIQFNSNGALSGNSVFTWNNANAQAQIGNILITQANNNIRNVNAWNANTVPQQARITMGTGFDGNFGSNIDPVATNRGAQLAVINKQTIGNADTNQSVRSIVGSFYADLGGGTLTNSNRRLQALQGQLHLGNGTIGFTTGPVYAAAAATGGTLNTGNVTIGAATLDMGAVTISHGTASLNSILAGGNSTIGNAVGTVNQLQFLQTSANITSAIGSLNYFTGTGSTVPTNVYGYYMPGTTATHGVTNSNSWRAATNYYFLRNDDPVAQVQLGSLRSYHEFETATATSGSFAIDKATAQVHNIVPTGNCTITGYNNMVVSASDGTNTDAQIDTLTIIVEQGATPYTVTLPTGAAFKYANNVSTVGTTANAVTIISVVAANVRGTTTYLTTVSSEFV